MMRERYGPLPDLEGLPTQILPDGSSEEPCPCLLEQMSGTTNRRDAIRHARRKENLSTLFEPPVRPHQSCSRKALRHVQVGGSLFVVHCWPLPQKVSPFR